MSVENTQKIPHFLQNIDTDIFRLCPPIAEHVRYVVNHHVKIWHVRLGGANNMRPLSWGHNRKRSFVTSTLCKALSLKNSQIVIINPN